VLNQVPQHEDVWGSGGTASRFLNLGAECRSVVSFRLRPLHPIKNIFLLKTKCSVR